MNAATLFDTLNRLRDSFHLKAHLLEMDLKDEWHALEKKAVNLESHLMQRAQQLGVAEEHYFVGSDKEIKVLVDEFSELEDKLARQDHNRKQ